MVLCLTGVLFCFYVFLVRYYFVSKLTQSWKGVGWIPPWLLFLWQHQSEIRTCPTRGTRLLPKYNFENNLLIVKHCILCVLQDYYRKLLKTKKSIQNTRVFFQNYAEFRVKIRVLDVCGVASTPKVIFSL
jgi:hypothetical protein